MDQLPTKLRRFKPHAGLPRKHDTRHPHAVSTLNGYKKNMSGSDAALHGQQRPQQRPCSTYDGLFIPNQNIQPGEKVKQFVDRYRSFQ